MAQGGDPGRRPGAAAPGLAGDVARGPARGPGPRGTGRAPVAGGPSPPLPGRVGRASRGRWHRPGIRVPQASPSRYIIYCNCVTWRSYKQLHQLQWKWRFDYILDAKPSVQSHPIENLTRKHEKIPISWLTVSAIHFATSCAVRFIYNPRATGAERNWRNCV